MAIRRLLRRQVIPAPIETVWAFFSNAQNLGAITPEYMNFRITSGDLPQDVYAGQIITYTVSPVWGIPLYWMTEITAVKKFRHFVDEQRRGPYRLWHHQHLFEERDGAVEMQDIVHYELPLGPLGSLAHALFVKRQLEQIFAYREQAIAARFGAASPATSR